MRRGQHPNSRANLRPPWGSGESGNLAGRPSLWSAIVKHMAEPPKAVLTRADTGMSRKEFMDMMKAGQKPRVRCSVCRHENLPLIDALLVLRISVRAVARNYNLARSSVDRHRRKHLPVFPATEEARAVLRAEELLPPLIEKLKHPGQDNLQRSTWRAFNGLWKAFEDGLSESAQDRLVLSLASACVWLYRARDRSDVRQAIAALESWGADGGTQPAD